MRPYPVTKPSPSITLLCMPKLWQRCRTSLSSSSKLPSSSKRSMRSRAESLPSLCSRAWRRRNSSKRSFIMSDSNMSVPHGLVIGTAGHIDHGKTTLIRALTGIDTDRLEEEKQRGISIDLGFAHLDLPDGWRIGFVDVPGHERFIKNML